jgi:hypothetical protein
MSAITQAASDRGEEDQESKIDWVWSARPVA